MQTLLIKSFRTPYHLASLGIAIGLGLTLYSALGLCSSACTLAHEYYLWGLPFEVTGVIFFIALAIAHYLSAIFPMAKLYTEGLIATGLGAEIFFILLQKIQIGSWCPICLGIAASVAFTASAYLWMYREPLPQGVFMKGWLHLGMLTTMMTFGFAFSFMGVSKATFLDALEVGIKEKIKFGTAQSPIHIYIFTDWACPACRKIEPVLEKVIPQLYSQAQITFVDAVVHQETLNYAPYNIAFMAHDKPKYFQIRDNLTQLALKLREPNDEDIQASVAPLGVKLRELPYQDVMAAMNYFEDLIKQYQVTGTPSIVIVDSSSNKQKLLSGSGITESGIKDAITSIK